MTGALLLVIAGCTSSGTLVQRTGLRLALQDSELQPAASTANGLYEHELETASIVVPASSTTQKSPWCDYLREDTAAQAMIMRSPTLSGSLNNEAKSSVSLRLSLSDQLKASAMEQSAEARCRRYLAENGLQKLIFVSPQGLTAAGYRAKAEAIGRRDADIKSLRRQVQALLKNRDIDHERAAALLVLADKIVAEAREASSQAARRLDADAGSDASASKLTHELLMAEADLEDINSRMRTLDAMDISASVGWNEDADTRGFDSADDAFSGKVSFSWKLGASLPSRYEHERRAKEAKLRAIAEGEGGTVWQVATLRRAHERALGGLVGQRQKLDDAIAEAERLSRNLASVSNADFKAPLLQSRLQLIELKANRAAVNGSIEEIEANMKRLSLG
ncbi:MAG: hypothetical protein LCH46_06340 [Proteobacteria bacterium]|nr:hypothetical protein [Pseudomonadota bacterium]